MEATPNNVDPDEVAEHEPPFLANSTILALSDNDFNFSAFDCN